MNALINDCVIDMNEKMKLPLAAFKKVSQVDRSFAIHTYD